MNNLTKKYTLAFSPCPNDTFIFDALVNGKIDTKGISFDVIMEDVETLNRWALNGRMDITKLSYAVVPHVLNRYIMLNSGSALGSGVGPLLISAHPQLFSQIEDELIAIPGENTTAHLLFSMAYPNALNKVFMRYDEVESFVLERKGLGVIIHENRFTYQQKGLHKIKDLGDYWETKTGGPIPLGGIAIKRHIDQLDRQKIDQLIRDSILFGFQSLPKLNDYIRDHAQEMSEDVMRQHIGLYVNDYSVDLGKTGRSAVMELINISCALHSLQGGDEPVFV